MQSRACSNYAEASKKARSEKNSSLVVLFAKNLLARLKSINALRLNDMDFVYAIGVNSPFPEIFLTHETNATIRLIEVSGLFERQGDSIFPLKQSLSC